MLKNKMSKMIVVCLVSILAITGCSGSIGGSNSPSSGDQEDMLNESHYGGAVLKEPARAASVNIYSVSPIERVEGYENFDRQVVVYGLTLMIHKDIDDAFVNKITGTMASMFPQLEGDAALKQEEVLQNMYRYKAMLPIVKSEKGIGGKDQETLMMNYSLCDIIMKTDKHQVNEVVEHLLHAISDVGLSYAYPESWGFDKSAKVKGLMDQAIEKKYYNVSGYGDYPTSIKHRILVQEYAYWAISSYWNLQESYGIGDSEWQLNNRQSLTESQGEMSQLIEETIVPIMVAPSEKTLKALGQ